MRRSGILRVGDPLAVLGLDPRKSWTSAEVKHAYQRQAKSVHPDAGGDAERFRALKSAYDAVREGRHGPTSSSYGSATWTASSRPPTQHSSRSHIFEERYNADGSNNYYSEEQQKGRTWAYGSERSYANESTRSFYRPYHSNYADPRSTGFTREEVAEAQRANRIHILLRVLRIGLLYGTAIYVAYRYFLYRSHVRETVHDDWLSESWWEQRRTRQRMQAISPRLQDHWTDEQKGSYISQWNADYKEREWRAMHSNSPTHVARRPAVPPVVSLHSRSSRGGMSPSENGDTSAELEDGEGWL